MIERERRGHARVLVVGVGNEHRGDDGVGLELARRLAADPQMTAIDVRQERGDPLRLLAAWPGYPAVIVIDAIASASPPGSLWRHDASAAPLPTTAVRDPSSHAVGVADAIELARALDRLPQRIIVFGVCGRDFQTGRTISAPVHAALPDVVAALVAEAAALAGRRE